MDITISTYPTFTMIKEKFILQASRNSLGSSQQEWNQEEGNFWREEYSKVIYLVKIQYESVKATDV